MTKVLSILLCDGIKCLNNEESHLIKIPLKVGTHKFSFHFDSAGDSSVMGMNLFFDGKNDRAGISVFAKTDTDGSPYPAIYANGANPTMGWPITDIPGAGTLSYDGADIGIWAYKVSQAGLKVTLKSFWISAPSVKNLDIVGPHDFAPSGKPDYVGQFTLEVEQFIPEPPELILWLQTVAGVTVDGPNRAAEWKQQFDYEKAAPPFSFTYGGKHSSEFLKNWQRRSSHNKLDEHRMAYTLTYTDPETGLQLRWEGVQYHDFSTVEWTMYFKNAGSSDTPILADIRALDANLHRKRGEEFLLHHWKGTFVRRDDYEPLQSVLKPGENMRFAPPGGRPCGHVFPYFNLETLGEGIIVSIGWPGQWAAEFKRDAADGLRIRAGQELTYFKLLPGEEIRTPLTVLQFWKGGDWIDSQNVWRRWMIKHNLPRRGGKLPPVPQLAACSSHQYAEMINANEENQKMFIDRYLEEGLKLDYWWMDAGWYVNEWGWPNTGTWEVDTERFPRGLRAITDYAHSKGLKTIVWFEPERVTANTWLANNHPEWIIGGSNGGLLDLGVPEALNWLTNHIDKIITNEGIDLYRQDYNIDPLGSWRSKDAPERQGITENHYVSGYLAYWDELVLRHPNMLIDSCASGGHRNDLETLRRSVPLLRSDYLFEPLGQQGHTYGLAFWVPFYGTAMCHPSVYDSYSYRSQMCPHNTGCFDLRNKDLDYDLIRRLYGEWKKIAPYYFGDYYPLSPYSIAGDMWIAWQFNKSETGEGMVQAFRRPGSDFFGCQFRLRGLNADAEYELTNFDIPGKTRMTGRELTEKGLKVCIEERPGAAVITYKQVR